MILRTWLLLCTLCAAAAGQARLQLEPAVATRCNTAGLAVVTLAWSGAGTEARLMVEGPAGLVPMSGELARSGRVETGPWVRDQMAFVLTSGGREVARATARVACVTGPAGSYFPLQLGHRWTYRTRSRAQTGATLTLTVTRAALTEAGEVWFEVEALQDGRSSSFGWFREAAQGRILRRDSMTSPEAAWLEPDALPRTLHQGPLGEFPGAVRVQTRDGLLATRLVYAPGVGLAELERTLLTGSSGGFTEGWELAAYRLGDQQREEASAASLQVSLEAMRFDVTNRQASNCAVPCYFTACGLVPGADPPGAYKPCFRASVTGSLAAPLSPTAFIELYVTETNQQTITSAREPLRGEVRLQRQMPLPTAPGRYVVQGAIWDGDAVVALAVQLIEVY